MGITLRHGLDAMTGSDLAARMTFAEIVEVEVGSAGAGTVGSGVLLNPEWVLTAAHLVNSADAGEVVIRASGSGREVSEVHSHPGWFGNPSPGLAQSRDLVLLRLSNPIRSAPVIPLWQGGGSGTLLGMMAGFGRGGNGLLGAYLPANGLRAGFNLIDRKIIDGDGGFWVTDFDSGQGRHNSLNLATVDLRNFDAGGGDPPLSVTVFSILGTESMASFAGLPVAGDFFPGLGEVFPEGTTARGDSGGPLFIYSEERSQWELAGVTSFGVNPLHPSGFTRFDSRYGDLSFFADVSGQQDWLNGVMIPEPSKIAFLFVGLVIPWRQRRLALPGKNDS